MGKASAQLFSGAGLGLMLGLLLGLSGTPVIAAVVGAIAALLGALVLPQLPGASPAGDGDKQRVVVDLRAGALGLACVAGLLGGIWLRTHDALSPRPLTLTEKWEQWKAIGFSPEEARTLAARGEGVGTTAGATTAATPGMGPVATSATRTILFGDRTTRCEQLSVGRFADTEAAARAYEALGELALAKIARGLSRLPDTETRRSALAVVVDASCSGA